MNKVSKFFLCFGIVVLVMAVIFVATPLRRALINKLHYVDQKVDDMTNYDTMKKVEDACRAMIASYESDKLTYLQYKDSDNTEKQSWGEQAKMRANKTAATYNSYILQNSFVWVGNVPDDIKSDLQYIE